MPVADYLVGLALLVAMLAAVLAGALLLLRRRLPWLGGADRVVAFALIATLGVLAVHLAPAIVGLLGRGSVIVAALVWLVACALVPPTGAPAPREAPPAPPPDGTQRFAMPLALTAVAAIAVLVVAYAANQATVPSASVDYGTFHMPDVVRWIQNGSIWEVASFVPGVAPGNYPNNGDVMLLSFALPWHNDFSARAPTYAFFVLTGIGVYALALRLGASRAASILAGCLVCAFPAIAVSSLTHGITDSLMLFGFAGGALFLVRHSRNGRTAELVLAGLALGLSFGTKWYGVSSVAVVLLVWAVATYAARRDLGKVVRQGAALSGLVLLAGGVWLLRNWIESGNPVFPVKVDLFGLTIFDAPPDPTREAAGYTIFDYVGDWDLWWKLEGDPALQGQVRDGILLQWWHALAAPALLIAAGTVAAAIALVRRSLSRSGRLVAVLAAAVGVFLVYGITPYTAGGPEGLPLLVGADSRYVVGALLLGAALLAWVAGRARWGVVALGVLALAAIAHGARWATNGELSGVLISGKYWAGATAVVGAIALCAWALERWWPRLREASSRTVLVLGVGVALAAAVAVAGGHVVQKSFNEDRYLGIDPVLDTVQAAGEGRRIGLAGVWTDQGLSPILTGFGPRFGNEVEYVGPIEREMRRRYETRAAFVAALEEGNYDLLVVGRGRHEAPNSPELEWAVSAGWRLLEGSDRLVVYAPPG